MDLGSEDPCMRLCDLIAHRKKLTEDSYQREGRNASWEATKACFKSQTYCQSLIKEAVQGQIL